jgi:hypothetical protein
MRCNMNRKIIQKVIDELKQDEPKLDYIRGILETLIESLPEEPTIPATYVPHTYIPNPLNPPYVVTSTHSSLIDEGAQIDKEASARLEALKGFVNPHE